MKKQLAFVLVLAMCFSIFVTPLASAKEVAATATKEVAIVDTEGNYLGSVTMSASRAASLAAGAYITFKGIKALLYTGYMWVCTHPQETLAALEFLIQAFDVLQAQHGQLQSADHDGTDFVALVKVNGNSCVRHGDLWACKFSL